MPPSDAARQAARLIDPVEHGLGILGIIGGMLLGAVVGALLVAATIATGGGALAIAIAAVAAVGATAGGGLAGRQLINGLSTLLGGLGITTGMIIAVTSPNVVVGGLFAARAQLDGAACSGAMAHSSIPKSLIAEGSATVLINGMPAARQGDKLVCAADIEKGEPTVLIGGQTVQVLPIHDLEAELADILGKVALGALIGVAVLMTGGFAAGAICGVVVLKAAGVAVAFFLGNELLGLVGDRLGPGWRDTLQGALGIGSLVVSGFGAKSLFREPIDGVTGEVCMQKTDIALPGALALVLERTYVSGQNHESCFGPKWFSTWGQCVDDLGTGAIFYGDDGRVVGFDVVGSEWARNPRVNTLRLRRTPRGFEVLDEQRRTLRFETEVHRQWLLTTIEDWNGNRIRLGRDADGAVREVTHSGGYRLTVEGTATRLTRVSLVDLDGSVTDLMRYTYDAAGRLAGVIDGSGLPFRYEYDGEGRITRWHDRAVTWYQYRYDAHGRCTEAVGPERMYQSQFEYHRAARTNRIVDSMGGVTTILYNERGQITHQIDPRGGVTCTTWDERSNKLEEIDPVGAKTSFEYDDEGNLVATTDPLGRTTRVTYTEHGLPAAITDAAGRTWVRSYDGRGNLIAAGLSDHSIWRYTRDAHGNLSLVTDPSGKTRHFAFDAQGLPGRASDWEGNVTTYRRDSQGRVVEESDPLDNLTVFRYNSLGKLSHLICATAVETAWEYDAEGNLIRRIRPDGHAYRYTYGPFDVLTEIIKPGGGSLRFHYDTEGRLSRVENELNEVYRYEYNATGQVITEEDFSGRRLRFDHDASGQCVTYINGSAGKVRLERDALGQLLRKVCPDGRESIFEYDIDGHVTRAKNDVIDIRFERDPFGRVLREVQGGHIVESRYDAAGHRTGRRIGDGREAQWHYDGNGLLLGLGLPDGDSVTFHRDALGREVERRTRSGLVVRQNYDRLDRLTAQWAEIGKSASGSPAAVVERRYAYDDNDSPVEIWDRRSGWSRYSYDRDGRIANALRETGASEEFEYDQAGYMLSATRKPTARAVALGRHQTASRQIHRRGRGGTVHQAGSTRYQYDDDGRLVQKITGDRHWRYEWNAESMLSGVLTSTGEHWTYEYDAFGRRVRKHGPTGSTTYVWDAEVIALERADRESATDVAQWFFEPGGFRPLAKQEDGRSYTCLTDHIGTPHSLIRDNGVLAWSMEPSVWGEREETAESQTGCALRFQGQWYDEESGLAYNWHRYYEAGIGQYVSPDPSGLAGGSRSYAYVDNPLSWVDPFGLAGCTGQKPVADFPTKSTKNWSAQFDSEGAARNLARQKLGKNPVQVEPGKWRSADGKWQYRSKPGDVRDRHVHLEELDPRTGEVLQNAHLRWPEGTGR